MKASIAALVFSALPFAVQAADINADELIATFLDCDVSTSAYLANNAAALGKLAATKEVRKDFRWFDTPMKIEDEGTYVAFSAPLKLGKATIVGAGYMYTELPGITKAEYWGLYFKEDMQTVMTELKKFPAGQQMKAVNVDGEQYARLRHKEIAGEKYEWVNILEPLPQAPLAASSYLTCSLQK